MYDYFSVRKVLIIAPLRVAKNTWTDEINKWDHLDFTVSKIIGTVKERQAAIRKKADLYIINRENVTWLVNELGQDWDFDMVVIDELSSFKSAKSQRFKSLRKVRPLSKRVVGLTGTPAPNGLLDLWPQIYLLDRGEALGKTITGYRERYFTPIKQNGHIVYKWGLRPDADKAIHKKIEPLCISMEAVDWLDMPERIDNYIRIDLPDKTMQQYKEFERNQILQVDNADIVALAAAAARNKLLQFANGAVYDDEKNVIDIHDEKLKALEEIIEEAQGQPVMVFYNYQHDLMKLRKYFDKMEPCTLDSDDDIARWNNGDIQLLLVHPASMGHGLNLQSGGNIIVWFGLNWSLELYQQANARLWRQGQKETVIINHIVAKDTIDEDVLTALENKDINQQQLIEAVKKRIKEAV
nr:DEAD/DEAH box helicase [Culicoidibacter larvae]